MIKISKEESKYLQKQGFRFGSTLHKTVHGYNYYMSEYADAMNCLENYRNRNLIQSFTNPNDQSIYAKK
jgi:hypothetical protein